MSDNNSILFGILWILLGFIIIVTAIYLPDINTCDGWCCAKMTASKTAPSGISGMSHATIPYQPRESKVSLNQYTREQSGKESGNNTAVLVLENFFSGLATLNIPHQPIYNIAKLAAETRPEKSNDANTATYTYLHKNKFPLVAISGKKGTAQEIYMAAYLAQALSRENNGILIINGMTEASPALEAWSKLIEDGIIHWKTEDMFHNENEDWAKGTFTRIDPKKSVSEYLSEILSKYLELTDESKVQYYITSKEREDELRKAYKTDKKFTVNNVTTVFHATVLKVMYPTINIFVESLVSTIPEETTLFPKAVEFLEKYILV
jgi:hypothetical protein